MEKSVPHLFSLSPSLLVSPSLIVGQERIIDAIGLQVKRRPAVQPGSPRYGLADGAVDGAVDGDASIRSPNACSNFSTLGRITYEQYCCDGLSS